MRERGFTLIDLMTACVVVGALAVLALPSFDAMHKAARRADAVAALTLLQQSQEQHRNTFGVYATEFAALRGAAPTSPQGLYAIDLERTGPESYRARATAGPQQAGDRACPTLTIEVNAGFATIGPNARCWQR